MCLNPAKCAFGVSSGPISRTHGKQKGNRSLFNLNKDLAEVKTPELVRDVQSLTVKIATLSRFISRMSDRCQTFFQSIKKNVPAIWGDE